jgi:hypothetical protein
MRRHLALGTLASISIGASKKKRLNPSAKCQVLSCKC